MNPIHVMPSGKIPAPILESLSGGIHDEFGVPCRIQEDCLNLTFAYHHERQQYHATEILMLLSRIILPGTGRLLLVTAADLYIPILTFVFGEAQLEGRCAVVSTCRLEDAFYGLPSNPQLTGQRLMKEALHELGHTFELNHCENYRCIMAASHSVEWIDLKECSFCRFCRSLAENHLMPDISATGN